MGLERISLICIDNDIDVAEEIMSFDIDKAHAFGPNKEYRLRSIMIKVLNENLIRESFRDMINLVKLGRVQVM